MDRTAASPLKPNDADFTGHGLRRFKPYPEYKDSGVEWLGKIPGHWEVKQFKRVARLIYGDSLPNEKREAGEIEVYGSNGPVGFHSTANTLAPALVVGRKGSYGKVNFVNRPVFAIDTTYIVDERSANVNLRWLFYVVQLLELDSYTEDSAIPGLAREFVYGRVVPKPALIEQLAIVEFVDRETSKIDALISKRERLIELLQEKRAAMISQAVAKGLDPNVPLKDSGVEWLGEIPSHWNLIPLKYCAVKKANAIKTGPFGSQLLSSTITDRRVLDRQLQRTVRQFEQTAGVVENIDTTSRQLKDALESGKTIIVTTLQKFPVIVEEIGDLPGKRFAVLVDEAHSSQSGESTKSLKAVLSSGSLEEAEQEEAGAETPEEELENRILSEMEKRGRVPNVSWFAFTATPKSKTFELFGTKRPDGRFEAFSLYSMRQAIEEGFILDVLENYTTYKVYWKLLKKIENDPHYEKGKASYLLRSFVDLHEHALRKKVEIMVEHFHGQVAQRIRGRAKAMIVTRSRLHAVRYKQTLDAYLRECRYPHKALVAFSGTVRDMGIDYTEANMNGYSEKQTAEVFKRPEYRFLVVANKFQTGFDQPLLHTMYVDKRLGGVNAVQTLSRLNRVHPEKAETIVLDFANDADEIRKAFEPYYEKTLLSEATDPNLLYDLERQLTDFHVYDNAEVEAFSRLYFNPKSTQDQLYAMLAPCVDRYEALDKEQRMNFRGKLTDYVRLYAFLSQILAFADVDLEKLYVFSRLLRRYLPTEKDELPREIQQKIDMESYRIRQSWKGKIKLERGEGELEPIGAKGELVPDQFELLSQIIRELNERFGTDFTEDDKVFIQQLEERLVGDPALVASVRVNTPENARLTFDHVVTDRLQDMVDTNFKFYKRITDDREFSKFFLDWLFERFRSSLKAENSNKQPNSKSP